MGHAAQSLKAEQLSLKLVEVVSGCQDSQSGLFCFFFFLLGLIENPYNLKLKINCLVLWKQMIKLHKKQQS